MEGVDTAGREQRWSAIAIAPSVRWPSLASVLKTLAHGSGSARGPEIVALADLYDLSAPSAPRGRLLLDGDAFSIEDLGWLRRFLAQHPEWQAWIVGDDATRATARAMLALERTRWVPWPLDLLELEALVRVLAPPAPRPPPASADTAPASAAHGGGVDLGVQLALLADISQRLELAFAAWREAARTADHDAEVERGPENELRRLMRFTRTLSCCVAPPPRGDEEFDLVALIDEQLAGLTLRGRKGPRFTTRGPGDARSAPALIVRADRASITLAAEAVLGLAARCAGAGEVVRLLYASQDGELAVTIEFPAGPLSGSDAASLLDPSVMRERLPEYGPNELPAAAAILRSQGGELTVADTGASSIAVQMRLPLQRSAKSAPAQRTPTAARASGNDPFA